MRADAPPLEYAATGLTINTTMEVRYAGRTTVTQVPVGSGRLVAQVDQDVPERLTLTLPREWEGATLDPGRRGAAFGTDGHQIVVTTTLTTPDGSRQWVLPMGTYQAQDWGRDGAHITVRADGLLRQVADHRRATPRGIKGTAPTRGELAALLLEDDLQAWFHPSLPDRLLPTSFVFGEDRLDSVYELAGTWPARVRTDEHGLVRFLPALPETLTPGLHWHDGEGGTVVGAPVDGSRAGVFNHAVVIVKPPGNAPEKIVERFTRTGRLNVATYGTVTETIESDGITTIEQGNEVADAALLRAALRSSTVPVEMVPDFRVQLDDPAEVKTAEGDLWWGRVTGIDLPLTHADGAARVDVGVLE